MKNIQPPKQALKFLRWFCREDYIEEIEGDLVELFQLRAEGSSHKAGKGFVWDVIRSFRIRNIKSFKGYENINTVDIIQHTFLMALRSARRYTGSFLINLIGLSTGLACALLIYLWVDDELGIDKFHEKDAQLYQVLTNQHADNGVDTWNHAPVPLAPALSDEFQEIEYAVRSSGVESDYTLSYKDKHFAASGQFVDENYFKIFSFELIHGNPASVLADKHSIVISESMALKLFETTENIIGKTLDWQIYNQPSIAMVSGVFKDVPKNSSDPFDFALSFDLYEEFLGDRAHWGNHNAKVYLVLHKGTNIKDFGNKLTDFIKSKKEESIVTLLLQRYSEKYLHSRYENGQIAGGRIEYVRLFSIIAIFILVIACINFMNLSTARASRRMKEVGIKKAIGAHRGTLILQYFGETLFVSFISLLAAVLLLAILLPQFNVITGKEIHLTLEWNVVLSFLAVAITTGILAGSYPALYLSGFQPVVILSGKLRGSLGELWIRKGLVVFQFTLSAVLILSVMIVYQQIDLIQSKSLGYNRDNIAYFNIEGNVSDHLEAFLNETRNIPGVEMASSMWGSIADRTGETQGYFNWEGKDPDAIVSMSHFGINYDMLELLGIEMKEGRTFSRDFTADTSKIIFNESAIALMGLEDPIGKTFNLWGNDMEIIGLTKDFHFQSLHENIKPLFIRLMPNDGVRVMVKIRSGAEHETITAIQQFYESYNPGFAFSLRFLDDEYQSLYTSEQRVSVFSQYFAGLAILISCLGLFGLAAFTAEKRTKEIGIRKILGSSVFGIVRLLSVDLSRIVLVSIFIALPLSYVIAVNWLESFAFRIDLKWWYFLSVGVIVLLVAWLTVGMQTWRAARINPTQCLKDE